MLFFYIIFWTTPEKVHRSSASLGWKFFRR